MFSRMQHHNIVVGVDEFHALILGHLSEPTLILVYA
ncbi:MAG: hypothetical protein ACI9WR_001643 [Paracoccaceae bacterium]